MTPPEESEEPEPEGLGAPAIELIPPSPGDGEPPTNLLSALSEKGTDKRDRHRDRDDDNDKDKLMAKMREQVVKGRERIDTISKKIVVGVARGRRGRGREVPRAAEGARDHGCRGCDGRGCH